MRTTKTDQGPVVQSIVSLTSSLVVKILTDLVSTIPISQVFLLKKCEYSHFFCKNISIYAVFNDQNFNNTLSNNIVSFEQLNPDCLDEPADLSLCWAHMSEGTFSDIGAHLFS